MDPHPLSAPASASTCLVRQAAVARALGSPFVAAVLEASERHLHRAPRTAALVERWDGDRTEAALAMRLNGALHALARRHTPFMLASLYAGRHEDFDGAIGEAMLRHDAFIAEWMLHPPQTNEVGRAAAIVAALMIARRRFAWPIELIELGSSCGLNLNLARYRYDLGGVIAGDPRSTVIIAPTWIGSPPPAMPIAIDSAHGVDLRPLDVADAATRERLLSFVWADSPWRSERLERALAVAQSHPPQVDHGDAAPWLMRRIAAPQRDGLTRVVFHSMFMQYLSDGDRKVVDAAMSTAAAGATLRRPIVRISFEWAGDRSEVQLLQTCWPGGDTRLLAICHPYGDWIRWLGDDGGA